MEEIKNETVAALLADLSLPDDHYTQPLRALAANGARALQDLRLNVNAVFSGRNLNRKEGYLLALSVAVNERHAALTTGFEQLARKEGAGDAAIAETMACVSVMAANNVFFRFRHYLHDNAYYNNTSPGLRMNVMMSPALGRQLYELMSIVISAVNGCERCVTSHEASAKQHGASEARIYDAVRLAAAVRGLCLML